MRTRTIFGILLVLVASRRVRPGADRRGEPAGRRGLRLSGRSQPGDPVRDRRQGLRPDLLRSRLFDLVFLSQPSGRPRAVRRMGPGRAHRNSCELAQAESTAVRATQPGQILPPRRAHCHCARIFSGRRHLYRRPHRLAYRLRPQRSVRACLPLARRQYRPAALRDGARGLVRFSPCWQGSWRSWC